MSKLKNREDCHKIKDRKKRSPDASRARGRGLKDWSIRRFREGTLDGRAYVEFLFPTEGGGRSQLRVSYSELRHPSKLLDKFADYLPVYPPDVGTTDNHRTMFLRKLVSAHAGPLEWVPNRTGFHDLSTFVTHSEIIRADGTRASRHRRGEAEARAHVDLRGTAQGERNGVLKFARYSTYLAFAIGVALAAPLPSYVGLRRQAKGKNDILVTETAVFDLSGRSSSGKSSACLAAMSLAGSPDRMGTLDFSRRGLAEMANDHNDLPFATDDTEKAEDGPGVLVRSLKALVHMLPAGRSKTISRGVDPTRFPELRWSTFGLCSSPLPISVLADKNHWQMSPGDKVRLLDIGVPGPKRGGIFDRISGSRASRAKQSLNLIGKLQRSYLNHYGNTYPLWVHFLMTKDRSMRIIELANKFIDHAGARTDGWEVRFAQKFGVIYAAMELGVDSRILPWPKDCPLKVATKCYRKAREAALSRHECGPDVAGCLRRLVKDPNRIVAAKSSGKKPTKISRRIVAIRYIKAGKEKLGILDDALLQLLGTRMAKAAFTAELAKEKLVPNGHGHAGTIQEHIPIKRKSRIIASPRLWVIDVARLERYLKNNRATLIES
ncbi:MAG: DUF927 domain-containing protein [Pseudolabrys sp.]